MNVQDYQAAGFNLSNYIEQAFVTRAEKDIIAAYIVPLLGSVPTEDESNAEPLKTAIMSLAFLLVQQRNIAATRAGAKTKMSEQSNTPTADDILRQNAPACVQSLKAIANGKNIQKECSDICGLFFSSHFFGRH